MSARREERYEAVLPVKLEQGVGLTRDISASGVYFETEVPFQAGASFNFTVQFDDSPGGPLRLDCEARIVRVEQKDGKVGVAASITNYKFERLDKEADEPS